MYDEDNDYDEESLTAWIEEYVSASMSDKMGEDTQNFRKPKRRLREKRWSELTDKELAMVRKKLFYDIE